VYTRCPGCHTVHPLNAPLLAQGAGKYRCGKCNKLNDALESLFDEWPDASDSPAANGDLPVLGISIDLEAAKKAKQRPDEDILFSDEDETSEKSARRGGKMLRTVWFFAAIALLITVVINLGEYFQQPLLDSPVVRDALVKTGMREPPVETPFRDLEQIQLVSRDMRSHPTRTGALRLSATIVNRAPRAQAFPGLEVILMDSGGQALASRMFKPGEYLAEDADIETGMTPEAYLPINLDLADPGNQAVGFELHFREAEFAGE
jgi:predicted Zn finger-like uncharacterized protein